MCQFVDNPQPYQSYFWLRAPLDGDVVFKNRKKDGGLDSFFNREASGKNKISNLLSAPQSIVANADRHLTIFEQPRNQTEQGEFRFQPIDDVEDLVGMVNTIQNVAHGYMPLRYGGKALEIIEKTNKLQLMLNFNDDARYEFQEFYTDLMDELADDFKVYDLYTEGRESSIVLSKAYKKDLRKRDYNERKSAIVSFNAQNESLKTKTLHFDRLILGQGFYDIHNNRLASRDVATIHFDGSPFDWHCDDPLNENENTHWLNAVNTKKQHDRLPFLQSMPHPSQDQANAQRRPLPVS